MEIAILEEKSTIKMNKSPTKHFLRKLKASLTMNLNRECTFGETVIFLMLNRVLTEREIISLVNILSTDIWEGANEKKELKILADLIMKESISRYKEKWISKRESKVKKMMENVPEEDIEFNRKIHDKLTKRFKKALDKLAKLEKKPWEIETETMGGVCGGSVIKK
ncbi:hypothetical protein AKJ65_04885 [candidate division MSBL1 archaeon SCGC-AAA259E19]|uniref:Uncharacterized protein n=1 Tax=candidate division MSBL1 archaeon SCGC-AAA259E19 TaxID=1698264 RepID=A0A133UJJ8_9EURY|nr:hypothetical protein AKJ65_04885 [candidate division MSBL1 archaeon SCGC-AAA259E19]